MADLEINTTVTHAGQAPVVETKIIPVPPVATVVPHDTGITVIEEAGKLPVNQQTIQSNVVKQ
jgi:hypothetical protein